METPEKRESTASVAKAAWTGISLRGIGGYGIACLHGAGQIKIKSGV
jgi:hypothetical protein